MDKSDTRNLKKRYLIWCYKTVKEAFDRIERKFTQLEVDRFILKQLQKAKYASRIKRHILEFNSYINKKEKDGLSLKYEGKALKEDYLFLLLKLEAVERAITKELGRAGLKEIKSLYEEEMAERILKSSGE